MLKRILFGGGALTAAYLIGSLTLGGAFAQTSPPASPTTPATTRSAGQPAGQPAAEPAGQAETPDTNETGTGSPTDAASEASDAAALASQAKVTADQARATALTQFAGATMGKVELDNENGVLAYSVKLTDSAGKHQDLSIDATSGTVLQAQAEAAESQGTSGIQEGPDTGD